jgi:CDP-diacylglycerol--serine O-phosphatidyltransferase
MKKHIPNLFTLLNLLLGCMAIVMTLQNGIIIQYDPSGNQFIDIPEKVTIAGILIYFAALIDVLDGAVARWLKVPSELGKQLDSLSDVVSFGVAPSMIMYQFLRMAWAGKESGIETPVFWLIPAFLIALSAAYRLGKFNLITENKTWFTGMPSPAAGLFFASFPLVYWYAEQAFVIDLIRNPWFLYAMIIFVSWLMISSIPMWSLKSDSKTFKNAPHIWIMMIVAVPSVILFQWTSVFILFVLYILLSLVFKNKFS